jgi:hypothetical protein
MQHLEVSGAVVLYIGRTVSKGECVLEACTCRMLLCAQKKYPWHFQKHGM